MSEIKWSTRAIEGLIIGIGASLAFSIFTEMQLASKRLEAAKEKFQEQESINIEVKNLVTANVKEILVIRSYAEAQSKEIKENIQDLSLKINKLNKQLTESELNSSTRKPWINSDWKPLTINTESYIPVITPQSKWPVSGSYPEVQIESLNQLIDKQQKIEFK